jgi:nicotinamide mononucleotide transporter
MVLQLVSIIQCIYGIIKWNEVDTKEVKSIGYKISFTLIGMCMLIGVAFTLLTNKTNDNWLYLDGVGGIAALLATYLLVIKKIEAWWIFIINNVMLITLCVHQNIYYIAAFNILLIILSIIGYKEWKKNLKLD